MRLKREGVYAPYVRPPRLSRGGFFVSTERLRPMIRLSNVHKTYAARRGSDEHIALRGINLELCPRVDDEAVKQLSRARGLVVLGLMGVDVSEKGLESLQTLKNLRALDLEICEQVSDTGCQALGQMSQLRVLILKKTGFEKLKITDAGLSQLAALQELEVLNLYGNKITDVGLVHLRRFPNLQSLDLSLTAITDHGLIHVSSLKQLSHVELLYSNGFAGPRHRWPFPRGPLLPPERPSCRDAALAGAIRRYPIASGVFP